MRRGRSRSVLDGVWWFCFVSFFGVGWEVFFIYTRPAEQLLIHRDPGSLSAILNTCNCLRVAIRSSVPIYACSIEPKEIVLYGSGFRFNRVVSAGKVLQSFDHHNKG